MNQHPRQAKVTKRIATVLILAAALQNTGCATAMLATHAMQAMSPTVRMALDGAKMVQKDMDVVLAPGVTSERLAGIKQFGLSVDGGQAGNAPGMMQAFGGNSVSGRFVAELMQKEFLKLGRTVRLLEDGITEANVMDRAGDAQVARCGAVMMASFSTATSGPNMTAMQFGADPLRSGIVGFSLKALDPATGDLLFVLSTTYGTPKEPEVVARDLAGAFSRLNPTPSNPVPTPQPTVAAAATGTTLP